MLAPKERRNYIYSFDTSAERVNLNPSRTTWLQYRNLTESRLAAQPNDHQYSP
ncbi:MAG: hypothetical protein LBU65_08825 [Planctomycetaceae bacterium]|nr:hypothetical protein [Planctomycetaceae bacterium]